jgi:hypothetical protein
MNDKEIKIEEQKLSNLKKKFIFSFFQLHIDQCESFDVGMELTSIIFLLFKCEKKQYLIVHVLLHY